MTNKKLIDERYQRKFVVLSKKEFRLHRIEREAHKFEISCLMLDLSEEEKQYVKKLSTALAGDLEAFYRREV